MSESINETNKQIIRAGVMGWPVAHSLSPKLHGLWLRQYGVRGEYGLLPVEANDFTDRIKSLHADGYAGCNVTLPYKIDALDLMDDLSPRAQAIGAVNTVVVTAQGRLLGDNTDAYGYIKGLDHQISDWRDSVRKVAVIGAGGGAKAVIYGLMNENVAEIDIFNRTIENAEAVIKSFAPLKKQTKLYAYSDESLQSRLSDYDLIVNASPLGLEGQDPLIIDFANAKQNAIVSDIIYRPRKTALLLAAEKAGLRVAEGLHMLIYQAAPGFEYWFGRHPKINDDLIEKLLGAADRAERAA